MPLQKQIRGWIIHYPVAIAALFCALLTLSGWLALTHNWLGSGVGILFAAYVIGGYDSTREGLNTLWTEHELDVDLLMIVAALGAAVLGLWQQQYYLLVDGAVLILIFAISGALEDIAMQRTERNIHGLMQLTPETARRIQTNQTQGEQIQIVGVQKLRIGDRILVKPGDLVPADGLLQSGKSSLNQASITGESVPIDKTIGDEVFAGTLNGSGAIVLKLHKLPENNLIQRVIRLVETAKTTRPPSQQFLERFERGYARVIVFITLLLLLLPPLLLNWGWENTIYRALVFLVVASPCAVMAAIMPTLLSGIAQGARQGILFKDGAQLEMMGKVNAIAADKTGTLTIGKLQVCDIIPASGSTVAELLQTAASLEAYSEHPIAQAIVSEAQHQSLPLLPVANVQARAGLGITGTLEGAILRIGKQPFVQENLITSNSTTSNLTTSTENTLVQVGQQTESEGKTVIWISRQDRVMGLLIVADQIRPEAPALIRALKRLGIKTTIMLTGDNAATAQSIAQVAGIDQVYSNLLPEDKVEIIRTLQQQHHTVAMIGDGINDAPALAQASVGIAMGGTGSDIALETADVVLMADRIEKLTQAIQLGVKSQQIIKQNLTLAMVSIVFLMVANFLGRLTLPAGVLGHEGSTLLVTLNGMRLLRNK
ncbi:cadmium-translocating P-type ATPase [Synechococcus sp. PCC 7335]|nr:cadmium-translocating P-type ATPase [Synechococcus sp. PCC 7335]